MKQREPYTHAHHNWRQWLGPQSTIISETKAKSNRAQKPISFASCAVFFLSSSLVVFCAQPNHLQFKRLQSYQTGKSLYKNDNTFNRCRSFSFCVSFTQLAVFYLLVAVTIAPLYLLCPVLSLSLSQSNWMCRHTQSHSYFQHIYIIA